MHNSIQIHKSTTSLVKAIIRSSSAHYTPYAARYGSSVFSRKTLTSRRTSPLSVSMRSSAVVSASKSPLDSIDALIFDCDGVIVESEDIHRQAYNASFKNFNVQCPNQDGPIDWSVDFYDILQNTVGGGKPKMRWYFGENGWPTSSILNGKVPANAEEEALLVDILQEWKTNKYKDIIGSGEVETRAGILELMDGAKAAGVPVAVCSAGTKEAVQFVLENMLGKERFESLDLFMAGDDVPVKKPDPTIYRVAAERLQVNPERCIVIEDSTIGLSAALGAGMKCVITYTTTTTAQNFDGAMAVLSGMDEVSIENLVGGKWDGVDHRVNVVAA